MNVFLSSGLSLCALSALRHNPKCQQVSSECVDAAMYDGKSSVVCRPHIDLTFVHFIRNAHHLNLIQFQSAFFSLFALRTTSHINAFSNVCVCAGDCCLFACFTLASTCPPIMTTHLCLPNGHLVHNENAFYSVCVSIFSISISSISTSIA